MSVDGTDVAEVSSFYLSPINSQIYVFSDKKISEEPDHQYIFVNIKSGSLIINSTWCGEFPLFYFCMRNYLVISSSFEKLVNSMKSQSLSLELDRIAIFESMIFDYPLRTRTLIKDVKKLTSGKQVTVDLLRGEISENMKFVLPFHKGDPHDCEKNLFDHAVHILSTLIEVNKLQGKKIGLALSGGLDSRLLACLLKKGGVSHKAFTFGPAESADSFMARKVAKKLGIPILNLILENEYYKKYGDEVTWLTGGLSNHRHCHLYACLSENEFPADVIFHGYIGGEAPGASQTESASNYDMSKDEAMKRFLAKYVEKTHIWYLLTQNDKDRILTDLFAIMNENCTSNLPCHFDEYVHNVERQFSLISNVFSPVESICSLVRPFAVRRYYVFFNSLPFKYRINRYLYKKACSAIFPGEYKLGNEEQIMSRNSVLRAMENVFFGLYSRVSNISLFLTKGRIVIRNPKHYERHKEILCKTLQKDLVSAVSRMSEKLSLDLSFFGGVHLNNRGEETSQYRLLSLYTLIEQLEARYLNIG